MSREPRARPGGGARGRGAPARQRAGGCSPAMLRRLAGAVGCCSSVPCYRRCGRRLCAVRRRGAGPRKPCCRPGLAVIHDAAAAACPRRAWSGRARGPRPRRRGLSPRTLQSLSRPRAPRLSRPRLSRPRLSRPRLSRRADTDAPARMHALARWRGGRGIRADAEKRACVCVCVWRGGGGGAGGGRWRWRWRASIPGSASPAAASPPSPGNTPPSKHTDIPQHLPSYLDPPRPTRASLLPRASRSRRGVAACVRMARREGRYGWTDPFLRATASVCVSSCPRPAPLVTGPAGQRLLRCTWPHAFCFYLVRCGTLVHMSSAPCQYTPQTPPRALCSITPCAPHPTSAPSSLPAPARNLGWPGGSPGHHPQTQKPAGPTRPGPRTATPPSPRTSTPPRPLTPPPSAGRRAS